MKILCVSDYIDPLVYSASIKERFQDVDLVLSAGDLPLEYLEFIVSCLNKPLLFVFGNHNLQEFHRYKKSALPWPEDINQGSGSVHIGSQVRIEEGLIVAGLGGSVMYNRGQNQYTEFGMFLEMVKLIPALIINRIFRKRFLDILLTHAAPRDIHDKKDPCHRGFRVFRAFMRIFKPAYLIHGHIHLYDLADLRTTRYHDTWVVNAYSHYIINIEELP
ncbi:MAG: metallophosphoesterase [Spirochaetaceae bacterium]|jgi:Icc-related predicted phosphoesterase|nr:metallophosphoesterase [Spirochaetaceae bacterium]